MFCSTAGCVDGAVGVDGGFVDQDDVGGNGVQLTFHDFDEMTVLHHDIVPGFVVVGGVLCGSVQGEGEGEEEDGITHGGCFGCICKCFASCLYQNIIGYGCSSVLPDWNAGFCTYGGGE